MNFFRTDTKSERTEASAEKPGVFAVRQESKIIRIKIIETEKKEEEEKEAILIGKANNGPKFHECGRKIRFLMGTQSFSFVPRSW